MQYSDCRSTFCLGDFECTPITYQHLLLVSRRYGKPPIFIGPVLIHYRKNFSSFLFFASSLIGLRKSLEAIRVFGTDGEVALVDAFSHEFRFSTHLFCFNHVRNNIKRELQDRNFPESDVVEITEKIFGKLVGGVFSEGIVDAESETEFYENLEELKQLISEREILESGIRTGFFDWFSQYKVENIVSGMLKPVRREAGLGNPPSPFTTNASESMNAILKRKVDYKKNELHMFINHLKQLADEQENEIERAVIGRGKYRFHEQYRHLEVKESEWFKMNSDQRQRHMKKAASTHLSTGSGRLLPLPGAPESSVGNVSQLSVSAEHFHFGLKIPLAAVQGIWNKAEELLREPNAISAALGCDSKSRMVRSRSGKRPHLVTSTKQGMYVCDNDCPNWKAMKLCSHSVAVAELNGSLKEFCDLYRKTKRVPNMSRLALTGLPSGIGKKGNQVNRKRKREPENERIPLSRGPTPDISQNQAAPSLEPSSARNRPTTDGNQPGPCTIRSLSQSGPSTCSTSPQSYCLPYQGPYSSFSPQISAWSTHSGDINVYRPPFTPSPLHTTPPTQALDFAFRLCFRTGNISVCNGCRGRFDKHAESPHNLCVQHEEWRSYTSPVTCLPESRFGNAYYHVHPHCILVRWSNFHPTDL